MPAMETLKETFFENPFYVYMVLAVVEVVLVVMWYERRNPKIAIWLLAPVLLAGVVFTVERLVVTDRERIIDISRQIAGDLENGDVDAIGPYIDDNFRAPFVPLSDVVSMVDGLARSAAITVGKVAIARNQPQKITISDIKVEMAGRRAIMHCRTTIQFAAGEAKGFPAVLTWTVNWVKRGDNWLIDQAAYQVLGT